MKPNRKEMVAIFLVLALGLLLLTGGGVTEPRHVDSMLSFNGALWEYRGFDILGQVMLLLAGAFGVVVLLREESPRD
jgi:multisubunit Na+/H+ antiporter MnhB subunit